MEKVIIIPRTPKKDDGPITLDLTYGGKAVYAFSGDMDRIEEMIAWLFENTIERFVLLGTDTIYFENSEDAMAFRLKWGN